ncbi:hypothetical protein HPP92_005117 [Vanilla planifolia]|uniref:Uncharacterized protein n=1 Tax=Vanilla planifolia TaxID=51239 RepID=A0A835VEB4_VANPL|nr:hypothetical protein HPP92_005117 [Vanilla planifolia]
MADGQLPIGMDNFAIDFSMDDDTKLPCINDSFWEQFLVESPLTDDVSEAVESSIREMRDIQEAQNFRDSAHHMEHLTEQMGLLSPDAKN